MIIKIEDKAIVQAIQYYIVSTIIYNSKDLPGPRAIALRDILLYTKYAQVEYNPDNFSTYIYLMTKPNRVLQSYPVFALHKYKTHMVPYPQCHKALVSYILTYVKNAIINNYTSLLSATYTNAINYTHSRALVNKLPELH